MTNHLYRRVLEHKNRVHDGFTKRYNVDRLVYFESFASAYEADLREKQLKVVTRAKKLRLINANNPEWVDLFERLPPL